MIVKQLIKVNTKKYYNGIYNSAKLTHSLILILFT